MREDARKSAQQQVTWLMVAWEAVQFVALAAFIGCVVAFAATGYFIVWLIATPVMELARWWRSRG